MTQDEIIEMANKAGLFGIYADEAIDSVTRFANLVAAKEREACAQKCEQMDSISGYYGVRVELSCAEAIRARGEQA